MKVSTVPGPKQVLLMLNSYHLILHSTIFFAVFNILEVETHSKTVSIGIEIFLTDKYFVYSDDIDL